ncbi:MAG: recombination protein RecR [Pseudobdellovibrionaceae bacterium]|nr:recombination protein RecR [Bdellovibrionales bacterium]USN49036.1 MAG: recombination protein RecR [Pseudobdellovibrionaceae bacterium]
MLHVPSLEKLVHELNKLPGIGPKTAQRLSYFILQKKDDFIGELSEALQQVRDRVHECPSCFSYTEESGLCHYCTDVHRNDDLLCVVEEPSDIARIDASGAFRGRYHVLHGALSPLDGITPSDLKIVPLLDRIKEGLAGDRPAIREVILALDADLEGDTTVLYLAKVLREMGIKVTRIAHGVPIGGDIDYIDNRTLGRALENRIQI